MLHWIYIPMEDYIKSLQEDEYEYLHENDDELKGDKITDQNKFIFENVIDFIICKNNHDRDSNDRFFQCF